MRAPWQRCVRTTTYSATVRRLLIDTYDTWPRPGPCRHVLVDRDYRYYNNEHEHPLRCRQRRRQPRQTRHLAGAWADLDWESALTWPDTRRDYGEPRQCGIGYIGLCLFFIAFVDRADERRIICLRKANSREVNRYAKA